MQRWAQKGQKWYGPNRAEDIKKRWQQYTEELTKEILMTQRTTVVLSLTENQTTWNVKSSGPKEASL